MASGCPYAHSRSCTSRISLEALQGCPSSLATTSLACTARVKCAGGRHNLEEPLDPMTCSKPDVSCLPQVNDDELSFTRHNFSTSKSELIACTAQLRQIHRSGDICVKCLAIGDPQCSRPCRPQAAHLSRKICMLTCKWNAH